MKSFKAVESLLIGQDNSEVIYIQLVYIAKLYCPSQLQSASLLIQHIQREALSSLNQLFLIYSSLAKASIISQGTSSSYYPLEYLFKLAFEKCIFMSLGVSFKRQTGLSSYWNYISV
ncbi:hypothetical protein TTHERM_000561209 (macronuclear) [Tetrahymena thermophila SB210]|uniref:Uncharacterized protein n=1 Tax=Tetrahymena thermophila (strain SB210) TaxID=312017 RepID=W7XG49_TETTS|nr:hypothetical protein TTHERM_000561209 [Tetrahymena thermophila SB210]EWS75883.1 hypothetical protein TTHERM_000561209 [Tetrahymena thermophila SB210]|eukprot:XP_012651586.1 hypothetical protein TTHERM_000561209 [Tetrahymena thermophila SB210]